ncbi:uncharacterized protein LOC133198584 [Saccostrea echinata]|uniref:uncharacterized protein LOC133198584 n=1 Tax=Saccostrea echinata TaxID=191078 RepID=UPI002A81B2CF|nr:uncharacterized protein LOC133198584 [Saccostrea echinata]
MNRYRNILTGEAASAFKKLIGRFYWADDNIVVKHLIEVHERFCGRDCPLEKSNISLQETETEKPAVCPQGSETEKVDISPQDSETIERDESTEYHASSEDREKSICLHMEVEDGAESLDEESSGESESEMESGEEVNIKEEQDDFQEILSKAGSPEMLLKGSSTAGKEDCSPLNPHSNVKPKSTKDFSSIQMATHSHSKDATDLKGHVTSQSDMSRKSTDLNLSVTSFNCLNSVKTIVGDTSSAVEVPQPMNNSVSGQTGLTTLNAIQSYNTLAESRKPKNQFGISEIKSPLGQQQFFPVKSEPTDFSVSQTQGPGYSSANLNTSLPLNLPPSADQTTRIQALGGFQNKLSTTCNVFPQSLHTNYYQSVPQSPISVLPSFQAQQPPLNLALMINPVTGSPMLVYSQNLSNPSHSVNQLNLTTNPVSGVSVLAPNLENQSTSNQVTSSRSTTTQSSSSQSTKNQTTTIQSLTSQSTTTQSTSSQSTTNEATTRQSITTQSTSSQRKEQVLSSQEVLSTSTTLSPLETKAPNNDASAVQMENSDEQIVDPPCERDLGAPSQSETNKQTSSSMTAKRQISPPTTEDNISQNNPPSKRFKTTTEDEMERLFEGRQATSTKQNTQWGMRIFQDWNKECFGKELDMELVDPSTLSNLLSRFYCEARPKATNADETIYQKNTLKSIRAAINRHLSDLKRQIDIVKGEEFRATNGILEGLFKERLRLGLSKPTKQPQLIEHEDLKKISTYLQVASESAVILRQAVWYLLSIHFVTNYMEFFHQLKIDSFEFKTDGTGEYAIIKPETLGRNHGVAEAHLDKRLYAVAPGSGVCPVKLLRLLIKKTDKNAIRLFNNYRKDVWLDVNEEWFTAKPIAKRTFGTILPNLCKDAGVSNKYSPQCLRATVIAYINEGHDPQDVMLIANLCNEDFVKSYNRVSSSHRKSISTLPSLGSAKSHVLNSSSTDESDFAVTSFEA